MYNGIGLQTTRGSGTNGYVQANLANLSTFKKPLKYNSEADIRRAEAELNRKPNEELMEHQKKRLIELKCVDFETLMEENGVPPEEIEKQVSKYRKLLQNQVASGELDLEAEISIKDSHSRAKQAATNRDRMRKALKINEAFVAGSSFEKLNKTTKLIVTVDDLVAEAKTDEQEESKMVKKSKLKHSSESSSNTSSASSDESSDEKHKKQHSDSSSDSTRTGSSRNSNRLRPSHKKDRENRESDSSRSDVGGRNQRSPDSSSRIKRDRERGHPFKSSSDDRSRYSPYRSSYYSHRNFDSRYSRVSRHSYKYHDWRNEDGRRGERYKDNRRRNERSSVHSGSERYKDRRRNDSNEDRHTRRRSKSSERHHAKRRDVKSYGMHEKEVIASRNMDSPVENSPDKKKSNNDRSLRERNKSGGDLLETEQRFATTSSVVHNECQVKKDLDESETSRISLPSENFPSNRGESSVDHDELFEPEKKRARHDSSSSDDSSAQLRSKKIVKVKKEKVDDLYNQLDSSDEESVEYAVRSSVFVVKRNDSNSV